MKKPIITAVCALWIVLALLAGCKKGAIPESYRDGTYIGKSAADELGAYGEVTLVIENHQLVSCQFLTWQADGTAKGEEYGKVNGEIANRDYYDKAQLAVAAMKIYAEQYAQVKDIEKVDAIAGATNSYNQFLEAVDNALRQASQTA